VAKKGIDTRDTVKITVEVGLEQGLEKTGGMLWRIERGFVEGDGERKADFLKNGGVGN